MTTADKPAKKAHQLPEEFTLTVDRQSWAKANAPGLDARAEFDEFRDYARSIGWKKIDWEATWRNWLRKAYKRQPAWKLRAQAEPQRQSHPPVDHGPEMSNLAAFCNRIMLGALRRARGVPEDALERMIQAKNRVVKAWEPYPDDITISELAEVLLKELRKAYKPGAESSTT